jgi:hypothetical protein
LYRTRCMCRCTWSGPSWCWWKFSPSSSLPYSTMPLSTGRVANETVSQKKFESSRVFAIININYKLGFHRTGYEKFIQVANECHCQQV